MSRLVNTVINTIKIFVFERPDFSMMVDKNLYSAIHSDSTWICGYLSNQIINGPMLLVTT